jgi:predicted metal-binding membrane protein
MGSVRMGAEHGLYCLGCCWLLFAILFPLGIMNVAAMALVMLLIFAEKALPAGDRIASYSAAVLILYGIVVFAVPAALPTFNSGDSMPGMKMSNPATPQNKMPKMPGM